MLRKRRFDVHPASRKTMRLTKKMRPIYILLIVTSALSSGCEPYFRGYFCLTPCSGLPLAEHTAARPSMTPQWAPDGRSIVSAKGRRGDGAIYVIQADGARVRRISERNKDSEYDYSPNIHPSGSLLVFSSSRLKAGDVPGSTRGLHNFEIVTSDMDGKNVRRLTISPQAELSPRWSPEGSHIAFMQYGAGHGGFRGFQGISIMSADGSDKRLVVPPKRWPHPSDLPNHEYVGDIFPKAGPIWSPTGEKIAYILEVVVSNDPRSPTAPREALYVVDSDGKNQVQLFRTAAHTGKAVEMIIGPPAWSPDGDSVGLLILSESTEVSLRTVDLDRGVLQALGTIDTETLDHLVSEGSLSWAPAGQEILLSIGHPAQGKGTVHIFDTGTLTLFPLSGGNFASWSPDGDRIAVVTAAGPDVDSLIVFERNTDGSEVSNPRVKRWTARLIAWGDRDGQLRAADPKCFLILCG